MPDNLLWTVVFSFLVWVENYTAYSKAQDNTYFILTDSLTCIYLNKRDSVAEFVTLQDLIGTFFSSCYSTLTVYDFEVIPNN